MNTQCAVTRLSTNPSAPHFNSSRHYSVNTFFSAVARRCVPTGIDLEGEVESVFNFSSPQDVLDFVNNANSTMMRVSPQDLIFNLTIQSIIDGTA